MKSFPRHNFLMKTNLDITLRLSIKTNISPLGMYHFIKYQFQHYMYGKKGPFTIQYYILRLND